MPNGSIKGPQTTSLPRSSPWHWCRHNFDKARSFVATFLPDQHCTKFDKDPPRDASAALRASLTQFSANPSMSPRNDVNRMAKLAIGLGTVQHNIVLDSAIVRKESLGPLKFHYFCAAPQHPHEKSAPCSDALDQFYFCAFRQNQTI